jgi:nucleoside-diphosphate-sugar epimerase
MKVIVTGNTGMIGGLILSNCLASDKVTEVLSFVRKSTGLKHQKLTEIVIQNFDDYSQHENLFNDVSAVYFCIGVYTGQVADDVFKKITVDYPVQLAKALEKQSPKAKFCLLSGAGADLTEKSKTPFARYKGMAENQISKLNLTFYSFRPGYIYPVESRKEPNLGYKVMRGLYPLIKLLGKKYSIKSTELANAMFSTGLNGAEKQILENHDILNVKL